MHDLWYMVVPIAVIALIAGVTAKAVIDIYFKRKEGFVDKMLGKLKGANDGKRP
jgi:hypothetical protein